MRYYTIQQAGKEATVIIYGDLTPYKWDESDVTAYNVIQDIKDLQVDTINVRINSFGGSVSEGWAIYNALKAHPAKIKSYADGFVCSAAIYPFLAGEERVASTVSAFYLHQVLTSVYGNADELRKAADELEKLNNIGLQAFTDIGISEQEVYELQKAETWLTPAEALEMGIATELTEGATSGENTAMQVMQVLTQKPQQRHQDAQEPKQEPAPSVEIKDPQEGENKLQKFMNKFLTKC